MTNTLIILLAYSCYLMLVGIILILSWYSEKLDPTNQLPASIWDEIYPGRKSADSGRTPAKPDLQPVSIQIEGLLNEQEAA